MTIKKHEGDEHEVTPACYVWHSGATVRLRTEEDGLTADETYYAAKLAEEIGKDTLEIVESEYRPTGDQGKPDFVLMLKRGGRVLKEPYSASGSPRTFSSFWFVFLGPRPR